MNVSSLNGSSAAPWIQQRDSLAAAVTKNLVVTVLCFCINYINGTQLHTFRKHQIFRSNPRYILFIHLVINDTIQLLLSTLLYILSYVFHTINASFCLLLLAGAIFTTHNTPLNLAGMALERYVAICVPLRHAQLCTVRRTCLLMAFIWLLSACSVLPDLLVLAATEQLRFFRSRLFCARDNVLRSSYSLRKRDASHILLLVLVWLALFYTYVKILLAAKEATVSISKAKNTIVLHGFQLLLCMLNYVRPMFEQALLSVLPRHLPAIRFASYVFVQMLPRLVSPIVYGLRDQTFRRYVKMYLVCGRSASGR